MERMLAIVLVITSATLCLADKIAYWSCDQQNPAVAATTLAPWYLVEEVSDANGIMQNKTSGPPATTAMKFVTSGAGIRGDYGNALTTNNLNDCVKFEGLTALNLGQADFTVTGWFNSLNSARHGCVINHGSWDNGGFSILILKNGHSQAGKLLFQIYGNILGSNKDTTVSDRVVCDGKWHWFAGVVKDQTIYLYIDGKLQQSSGQTVYDGGTTATATAAVPVTYINYDMAATVDEISVFDTAVTAQVDGGNNLVGGELLKLWQNVMPQDVTDCAKAVEFGYRIAGDFNLDCSFDMIDMVAIANNWLVNNDPAYVSVQ